ncbi:MAG: two-component system response regulator [Rhodoferax sp.]
MTLANTSLLIADVPPSLAQLQALLAPEYRVMVQDQAAQLYASVVLHRPDVLLLGDELPGGDALALCRQLKVDPQTRSVAVMMLCARTGPAECLDAGAADFLTKPLYGPLVQACVQALLALRHVQLLRDDPATRLTHADPLRDQKAQALSDVTLVALASLAETRDHDTGNHIVRIQHEVRTLARRLQYHPRFQHQLDNATVALLYRCAPLHDIGKVAIPDRILLKPGKLNPEEFEVMKTHTTVGYAAIVQAAQALGYETPFLRLAGEIVHSHHERWDGLGYPQGLRGEQIPVSARLMAVADVYDALISRRVYKEPMPHAQAVAVIEQARGRHFDPDVVDAFLATQDTFALIAQQFADNPQDLDAKRLYHALAQPQPSG